MKSKNIFFYSFYILIFYAIKPIYMTESNINDVENKKKRKVKEMFKSLSVDHEKKDKTDIKLSCSLEKISKVEEIYEFGSLECDKTKITYVCKPTTFMKAETFQPFFYDEVITEEFDNLGCISKYTVCAYKHNQKTGEAVKRLYEYNDNNLRIRRYDYAEDYSPLYIMDYIYNKENILRTKKIYGIDGIYKKIKHYDEYGRKKYEEEYDDERYLKHITFFNLLDDKIVRIVLDRELKTIAEIEFWPKKMSLLMDPFNKNLIPKKEMGYYAENRVNYIIKYNEKGVKIKEEQFYDNDITEFEKTYDDAGELIKVLEFDKNGAIANTQCDQSANANNN